MPSDLSSALFHRGLKRGTVSRSARFGVGIAAIVTTPAAAIALIAPAPGAGQAILVLLFSGAVAGLAVEAALPRRTGRVLGALAGAIAAALAAVLVGAACAAWLTWGPDPLWLPASTSEIATSVAAATAVPAVPLGLVYGALVGRAATTENTPV